MIIDAHAHLDHETLENFVEMIVKNDDRFAYFTNSVDYQTSLRNISLAKRKGSIKAFVGIHPQIFYEPGSSDLNRSMLDSMIEDVGGLFGKATGIGEIGLDRKYGRLEEQQYLLTSMLNLAESTRLPVTFHCRDTISEILGLLSSYEIRGNMLFHWFAGSESELRIVHDKGIYTSFGPSIIFSKRMSALVESCDLNLILAETDSPTRYNSILEGISTPFLVTSVLFKMSMIRKVPFNEMLKIAEKNSIAYLGTQD